jgi:hypothetical protein
MQFDPENYPVADYKFVASSSLGIIAREYEVSQLIQLLQTMPATSPLYNTLVESVIESMNITDRDKLIKTLQASAKPDPAAQQAQQETQQAQMAFQRSQTDALNAQASESSARAQKILVEAQLAPQELEIDKIKAITANLQKGDQDDKEFERRLKIAEQALKEKEYGLKERGAFMAEQAASTPKENPAEQALLTKLTND